MRASLFSAAVLVAGTTLAVAQPAPPPQLTESRYLSGTDKDHTVAWDFRVSAGRRAGEWTTIPVPSNWEMHGFGTYTYGQEKNKSVETGEYRHRFDVPATWKGRRVFVVFEGSMTDTAVRINGVPAGPVHAGGFYEFSHEITPLVRFGRQNLLEVTVSEHSANASVTRAERDGDFWVLGGIYRPVRLDVVPASFVSRVGVDARADGQFAVVVHVDGQARAGRVTAQIETLDGAPVGPAFAADMSPGQREVRLERRIDSPRPWSAETPHLYRVRVTSSERGRPVHEVVQRFGFRTIEVRRGDGIYVNGRRVLLKGVNRHSFWPETGRTTSRDVSVGDVQLMKDMNMNAVRMSHYPPDRHFLEVCDELGLYVIDELTGWQAMYDTEVGSRLVQELVRRDVNHPSVILWANGNEGGFNVDLDDDYAIEDPQQRPVIHPWDVFNGIDTLHYAPYDCCAQAFFHGRDLILPTEFMHGLYDGGHGAGLRDYWQAISTHPLGAGGFLWVLADEGLVRTDRNGVIDTHGNYGADGILGPHREKEASFFTIRSLWSPVEIDGRRLPATFDGHLPIGNAYAFTNLKACTFTWQLLTFATPADAAARPRPARQGRATTPDIGPGATGTLDLGLPGDWRTFDALSLTATDATGREINTWRWMLRDQATVSRAVVRSDSTVPATLRNDPDAIVVAQGAAQYTFDRATGWLSGVTVNGSAVSFGQGPRPVPGASTLTGMVADAEGSTVMVVARYDGVLREARWRIRADGWLTLEYDLRVPGGAHPYFGVTFDYPADAVTGLRWLGRGPYRVWKNRLDGPTFGVWTNEANDTITGQSWDYPEFRGYFADLYWATLGTREVPITIVTATPGMFLRVLTPTPPADPRNTTVPFPEGSISILHAIPPIGTKFHQAHVYGPESQPNIVNGRTNAYGATLHFRFGAP